MMREKNLRELTLPLSECPLMPHWGTLKEAIVQLNVARETGHDAIMVFDEAYHLVGILSQRDILKELDASRGRFDEKGLPASWDHQLRAETAERLSRPVKDFMVRATATLDVSDTILDASRVMLREGATLLPVMEAGRAFGVVRLGDLFYQITNAILGL
jgi:CBS domain-containing protein